MKKIIHTLIIFCLAIVPERTLAQQLQMIDGIIGIVGNEIVLNSELQAILLEMGPEVMYDRAEVCKQYESLLYQKLLLNQSKLDSLEVSDVDVQQQVDRRLDYFVKMFGSIEEFEKYYGKTSSQLKDEYFDLIKDQLLVQRMQEEITKNLKVTPADVQRYFKTIPADSLPLIGEQLQYSQIMIEPQVRDTERERVISTLDSLRNRLAGGRGSMMLEASKWSEDPGSKYKGGCYPMQRKGSFVPEYEAAVATTPEGSYSPVFKSEYGYHIVKVIEKRGEYYESCHILMSPKIVATDLDVARLKLDTVRTMLSYDSLSFSKAAFKYSTEENTRNAGGKVMNNATGGTKHDVAQLPAELNLVLMEMKVGEISEPILTTKPDGSQAYIMYHLDARTPAHVANIKEDYEIFQNVAENDAKQKEIDKWVKRKLATTYSTTHADYATCTFQFPWGSATEKK